MEFLVSDLLRLEPGHPWIDHALSFSQGENLLGLYLQRINMDAETDIEKLLNPPLLIPITED